MPTYLWSARDGSGGLSGQSVIASSPEAARAILERQGFTDLRLQSDDFGNALNASLRADMLPPEDRDDDECAFTPDEELEFARPRSLISSLWQSVKAWSWAFVPLVIWNGCNIYRGWSWSFLNIIAAVLLAAVFYLFASFNAVAIAYDRLLHAVTSANWRVVALMTKFLRFLRWFNRFGVPEHELRFRDAQVTFEREGLDAALAHYAPCANDSGLLPYMYWSRVAQFQFAAQRFDDGMQAHERAFELGQKSATELIDRAYHFVHYAHDVRAARDMLAQTEGKEVTELARSYVSMCSGMIAYREGRFGEARVHLQQALEEAAPFRGIPLSLGHVRLIKSYLCIVCARLGEMSRSRKLFSEVAGFLKTHHELRLLDECRAMAGA